MGITKTENILDIRLEFFGIHGISKKNHKVDAVILNLRRHLLDSAQVSGQLSMDIQICDFFIEPSGGICGIQSIFTQDPSVCDAEILH